MTSGVQDMQFCEGQHNAIESAAFSVSTILSCLPFHHQYIKHFFFLTQSTLGLQLEHNFNAFIS